MAIGTGERLCFWVDCTATFFFTWLGRAPTAYVWTVLRRGLARYRRYTAPHAAHRQRLRLGYATTLQVGTAYGAYQALETDVSGYASISLCGYRT